MSIRLMAKVWANGPADPIDRSVLLCLANFADDHGASCHPSMWRIAQMISRSQRSVERSIAGLKADGWITSKDGRGRGKCSNYTLNIERLKPRQAVGALELDMPSPGRDIPQEPPPENPSGCRVKPVRLSRKTRQAVGTPHTPLKGVTINDPPMNPKELPSGSPKGSPDSRFTPFRNSFDNYFQLKNGKPASWDVREAAQLKRWLAANPSYTHEEWVHLLNNRARSPVSHAKRLSTWIDFAAGWLNGLADDWGKAIPGGSKNGNNGNHTKAGRTVNAARDLIAEIEGRAGAGPDGDDAGRGVEQGSSEHLRGTVIEGKR